MFRFPTVRKGRVASDLTSLGSLSQPGYSFGASKELFSRLTRSAMDDKGKVRRAADRGATWNVLALFWVLRPFITSSDSPYSTNTLL